MSGSINKGIVLNTVKNNSDEFNNRYFGKEKSTSDISLPENWKKAPSLNELNKLISSIDPYVKEQVSKVKKYIDILKNDNKNINKKNKENVSTFQPKMAQILANFRYSNLSETYLDPEDLFTLKHIGFSDSKVAKQNEKILNWQFKTQINITNFFDELIKKTVDQGTAFIKVGWEADYQEVEEDNVQTFRYIKIDNPEMLEQFSMLMQQLNSNPDLYHELNIYQQKAVAYFIDTNIPVIVDTVKEKQKVIKPIFSKPTLNFVDISNLYVDPVCKGDFSKANFVIHKYETTRAEILSNSDLYLFDKKELNNKIDSFFSSAKDDDTLNKNMSLEYKNSIDTSGFDYEDKARKRIVIYDYWGNYDIYGDGKLQQILVTWFGNTIIRMVENPYPDKKIPFVSSRYLYESDNIYGSTDASIVDELQQIKGSIYRSIVTSLGKRAAYQRGIPEDMFPNQKEKENFFMGNDYIFSNSVDPRNQMVHTQIPQLDAGMFSFAENLNNEAESATAIKTFDRGLSSNAYSPVATSTKAMLNVVGIREMSIIRRISNCVIDIGKKIICLNSKYLSDDVAFNVINEKYLRLNSFELYSQFNLTVEVQSKEEIQSRLNTLVFLMQTTVNSLPIEFQQKLLAEYARLNKMYSLAREFENYKQPPPDPLAQQQQQLEIEKLTLENEKIKADIELLYSKANELGSKTDKNNLEYLQNESGITHNRNMEAQEAQSKGNSNLAIIKELAKKGAPDQGINDAITINARNQESLNQRGLDELPRIQGVSRDPLLTGFED